MRIKLDEDLPIGLSPLLGKLSHDVSTVRDEGLDVRPDSDIWQAAQREARFLITQDLDFSDLRTFVPDASRNPPGPSPVPEPANFDRAHRNSFQHGKCGSMERMLCHRQLPKNTRAQSSQTCLGLQAQTDGT